MTYFSSSGGRRAASAINHTLLHPPTELSLTLKPLPGEGPIEMFRRLALELNDLDASILKLMVYGSVKATTAGTEAIRSVLGDIDWPMTWVEGASCDPGPISGIQVFALSGGIPERVVVEGRIVGSVFDAGGARHCLLGGLGPDQVFSSRARQTEQTLDELQDALAQADFALGDVVRTWFFLEDLLSWYGDFNAVRTREYSRTKFRSGSLPASTGVAGRNPAGAALAAGAWAMQPVDESVRAEEVASPLQCPAPAYGSSFSRAMELSQANGRRLLVSGTASIALDGTSCWPGDVHRQIDQTMAVVEAILRGRGLELTDTTRATAYFKRAEDVPVFSQWCAARGLALPFVPVHCDICRDDLLFEIELDGWKAR